MRLAIPRRSVRFLDPRRLDCFQDALAGALGVVVETFERHHPVVQVDEVDLLRVCVRMRVGEGDRDLARVDPLHFFASDTWLMVYFGISTVIGASFTRAWHDRREVSSRPHAL